MSNPEQDAEWVPIPAKIKPERTPEEWKEYNAQMTLGNRMAKDIAIQHELEKRNKDPEYAAQQEALEFRKRQKREAETERQARIAQKARDADELEKQLKLSAAREAYEAKRDTAEMSMEFWFKEHSMYNIPELHDIWCYLTDILLEGPDAVQYFDSGLYVFTEEQHKALGMPPGYHPDWMKRLAQHKAQELTITDHLEWINSWEYFPDLGDNNDQEGPDSLP